MLKFRSVIEKAVLKNPLNNFAEETQTLELRQDPLLGTWSRININRAKRVHQAHNSDADNGALGNLIKTSKENCFFCKENVEKKTPELPASMNLGKRLKQKDAILFPNLYPFAKYHAVCVLTKNHAAQLNQITASDWENALLCSINYLRAVFKFDKAAKFASINMNYMPPAAASIFHPHLQVICDTKPTVTQQLLYEKSAEFYKKNKKNYFGVLAAEDKERRILSSGKAVWLATYSPFAANDITGIFKGASSFFGPGKSGVKHIAEDLSRIFRGYHELGVRSANMAIFSGPFGEKNNSFTLHARIVSRPALQQFYGSDRGFLEVIHREPVVSTIPEDLAKQMRGAIK